MTIDEDGYDSSLEEKTTFKYSYHVNPLIRPIQHTDQGFTDCAVCYEPFLFPTSLYESLEEYKLEVLDKIAKIVDEDSVESKRMKKRIYYKCLKKYYNRLWHPHYKGYECSTRGCSVRICMGCFYRLYNEPFQCTHCRNIDWKLYMTKHVIPIVVGIALGRMGPPEHRIPFKMVGSIAY